MTESRKIDLKVLIAEHKLCQLPQSADCFYPIQVGAEIHEPITGMLRDNTGDNISIKNPYYCELTGIYWAWKNLKADYIGLCHYRRFFASRTMIFQRKKGIASESDYLIKLETAPVILPTPRNYFVETNYSQYVHAHHAIDLDTTREILEEIYPEYLSSYDRYMGRTVGHRFNMFVMRWDIYDNYCRWLFEVLGELERRLDISSYSKYDQRVFGFVAERLLDVWLEKNEICYTEMPVVFTEKQNWMKKGSHFILRKIKGEMKNR